MPDDELLEEFIDDITAVLAYRKEDTSNEPSTPPAPLTRLDQDLALMRQTQSQSLPSGTRLRWLKAALLRVLRVYTRSQAAFNGAASRAAAELYTRVRQLDRELKQARAQIARLEARLNALESPRDVRARGCETATPEAQ